MTTMNPRVARRRRDVSEDRARRRLRWILGIIAMVAVVALGLWLVRSPILSVSQIDISGSDRSDPSRALSVLGVNVGTPTIDVDGGALEREIETDPWVASAEVNVRWPGTITIRVTEQVPVAPARAGTSWVLMSSESTVLEPVSSPTEDALVIDIDLGGVEPGAVVEDPIVRGALDFASSLRSDLATGAVVYLEGGGLYATVRGHTVRLGRPVDLDMKATVLAALIDEGIAEGATIDLIAPLRPAVTNPQPQVEGEE